MPERRRARANTRLEIGSQRGRNSHQIGVLGIYDLQGLSYGRTELLVASINRPPTGGDLTFSWKEGHICTVVLLEVSSQLQLVCTWSAPSLHLLSGSLHLVCT